MEQVIPIPTLHLFPVLDKLLIELLASLSPRDWQKPTVAKLWTVKDVAAHLLDGNLRAMAALNDYRNPDPTPEINSYRHLVEYLNDLNAVWIKAMKRVSPQWLINQLEITGNYYFDYLQTLDPFAPAPFSVSWAGELTSLNWFHVAREYTEKWHHQQQIRDAVGKPGIMHRELFYPCMDTFMHAMPYSHRAVQAPTGTVILITVTGPDGGDWRLQKHDLNWALMRDTQPVHANATIAVSPDTAWKLLTKAMPPEIALSTAIVTGESKLTSSFFNTIAVMA